MKIVVGLGNPGKEYENTYHNIGFKVVDELSNRFGIKLSKKGCKSIYGEAKIDGQKILLVKPQTFMNLSGEAVVMFKQKFKDAEIFVVSDDIDLPKGVLRFREHGSAGTHNGLRNIVSFIGEDFKRLRVGIGKPDGDLKDFVLSKMDNDFDKIIVSATDEVQKRIQ